MINITSAVYNEAEISEYQGNPLIEALPRLKSPAEVAKYLNRFPKIPAAELTLPNYIRRHAMMRIIDKFLYPTSKHIQLEQMIATMLRRGYLSRNIKDKSHQENINKIDHIDFRQIFRNAGSLAVSTSVIGCSGTGKSTTVEAILSTYEQAIYHKDYQHTQLVWLKLECPHDGSEKGLCIQFFKAIDKALGSDYEDLYVKSRSTAESMLSDIARIAANHSLGLLVLDEIQHLKLAKSNGAKKLLNFFVTLSNVIHVPVLYVGTPSSLTLFSKTMRSARRASQYGSIDWGRFSIEKDEPDELSEWDNFINRLWRLQWFETPTPLTPSIKQQFWQFTQGIPHVCVTLFYLCQVRAITVDEEVLDEDLINEVYDEELKMIHPMIRALRLGREDEILKFDDLDIDKSDIRVNLKQSELDIVPEKTEPPVKKDVKTQLIELLTQMEIGPDIAPELANYAIVNHPDKTLFELIGVITNPSKPQNSELSKPKHGSKKSSKKLIPAYTENDLRLIFQADTDMYAEFKKAGTILDITPYL
ncbi:ATP-binding protein [Catenovulum sediminis]|uniref:ATP-binding protein n=1 Tax=Catenovulum sediminis TaxID=1740262 RepID=A0ABV1RI69_9ALTE